MRTVLSVSLPQNMFEELNKFARSTGCNNSDIVKESLSMFLWEMKLKAVQKRLGPKVKRTWINKSRSRVQNGIMIAVFDSKVLIMAVIIEGISRNCCIGSTREFSLLSCLFIMKELRRILSKKFGLSRKKIALAMEPVGKAINQIIKHNLKTTNICRDANDGNILTCALAAKADYLVTGDHDLLEIKNYQGMKILSPRDFEALFI